LGSILQNAGERNEDVTDKKQTKMVKMEKSYWGLTMIGKNQPCSIVLLYCLMFG